MPETRHDVRLLDVLAAAPRPLNDQDRRWSVGYLAIAVILIGSRIINDTPPAWSTVALAAVAGHYLGRLIEHYEFMRSIR